ncbi:MAG TPA: hypothetical protein VGM67_00835 [Gemmatimonadaceae bacterium]|jgi:hypothetical protein
MSDRRRRHELRFSIPSELSGGWLALQGAAGKLRLAPIPEGWTALSDQELAELVVRAGSNARMAS